MPRFEVVHVSAGLVGGRRRWLRMGNAGGITALLLGLDTRKTANANTRRNRTRSLTYDVCAA